VLLAWPVYLFFTAKYRGIPKTSLEVIFSVLCFALVALLNVVACIWPMKRGLKSLEEREL
jgi:hypothetical protein